jgi:hypothetical protein
VKKGCRERRVFTVYQLCVVLWNILMVIMFLIAILLFSKFLQEEARC